MQAGCQTILEESCELASGRGRDVRRARPAWGRTAPRAARRPPGGRRIVRRYPALMGIVVPFAVADFGSVTVSTPFLKPAVTFEASTEVGSRTARRKAP